VTRLGGEAAISRSVVDPADSIRLAAELAQERHVTVELQRAILPLHDGPFGLPGLRAVVRYLPASRDSRVGGDWYITAEMPGGHVLLAIGDVGGHGLAAAAGMARLRGALAGLAITGSPPQRLLGWLNDLVHHVDPDQATSVALAAGDLLLLYSDGLVERRDRPLEAGLATLTQAAAGIGDPERVITAVLAALGSTDPEDDTCLVALQVL